MPLHIKWMYEPNYFERLSYNKNERGEEKPYFLWFLQLLITRHVILDKKLDF